MNFILGVIPARGGSKRCPGKNLKLFRDKPLVQWTIDACKQSYCLNQTVGSSEDQPTLSYFLSSWVPVIQRPKALASDTATNEDVLRHTLQYFPQANWVVLLQPTSPLRLPEDIDRAVWLALLGDGAISYNLKTKEKNGAVYVCSVEWLKTHDFNDELPKYYMPESRSLDINYAEDFEK